MEDRPKGFTRLCPFWTRFAGNGTLSVALCTVWEDNQIDDDHRVAQCMFYGGDGGLPGDDGPWELPEDKLPLESPSLIYMQDGEYLSQEFAGQGPYTDDWWNTVVEDFLSPP